MAASSARNVFAPASKAAASSSAPRAAPARSSPLSRPMRPARSSPTTGPSFCSAGAALQARPCNLAPFARVNPAENLSTFHPEFRHAPSPINLANVNVSLAQFQAVSSGKYNAGEVRLAREQAAKDRAETIRTYVRGAGPAADALCGVIEDKIDAIEGDPVDQLRDGYQDIARTMVNRFLMQDMRHFALGEKTQFQIDIERGFNVQLQGVGPVSNNFATACDQFAKFVTRDQTATCSTLSVQMRRKAQLAMSLVQQGVPNAGAFGFGVLLSPNLNRNKLAIGNGPAQYTFSLSLDENGGLSLTMRGVQRPGAIGVGNDLHPCGPGSVVNIDVDVRIDQLELTRLAEQDVSQYDDSPVAQILDVQQPPRMHSQARFHGFAQPFRLQADVGVTFAADLR